MYNLLIPLGFRLKRLAGNTDGQDFIEYALMAAFVTTVGAVVIPYNFGPAMNSIFNRLYTLLLTLGHAG